MFLKRAPHNPVTRGAGVAFYYNTSFIGPNYASLYFSETERMIIIIQTVLCIFISPINDSKNSRTFRCGHPLKVANFF